MIRIERQAQSAPLVIARKGYLAGQLSWGQNMSLVDDLEKMMHNSELYKDLIYPLSGSMNVGIELTDTGDTATVVFGEGWRVVDGLVDPSVRITMSKSTFESIRDGEADAFALGGRSKMSERRPINFESIDPARVAEVMEVIKGMATFFFLPGRVKAKRLSLEMAGEAHGARPIPLVYWKDFRTAWYHVPQGAILNEEGEKDPWPQAFVVLKGSGTLKIGSEVMVLRTEHVYYIPRNSPHQIHAESPVELIWIAWDAE